MFIQANNLTEIKLGSAVKLRLKKLVELKKCTEQLLIKAAILQYIEHEEQAEKLKQETIFRWREVEQSKVVSNKAVIEWLDTWGTSQEKGRPLCGE